MHLLIGGDWSIAIGALIIGILIRFFEMEIQT